MIDAGGGRPISDVLLAQRRRAPDTPRAGLPDLPGHRGLDTPFPFTLTLPPWGAGHAPAAYLGARGSAGAPGRRSDRGRGSPPMRRASRRAGPGTPRGTWPARTARTARRATPPAPASPAACPTRPAGPTTGSWPTRSSMPGITGIRSPATPAWCRWEAPAARVYGTHAGDTQLAAGQPRPAGSAVHPAGTERDADRHQRHRLRAHSPSWLPGPGNTGRRDAASLAWSWPPRAPAARTHMQRTASRSSRP
jgi:hypothetical protein